MLFTIKIRAWLINKTVGNVTGPSTQKALFLFSLYKLLLNAKILCALTDDSIPSNAEHSHLIKVSIHLSLGQEALTRAKSEASF